MAKMLPWSEEFQVSEDLCPMLGPVFFSEKKWSSCASMVVMDSWVKVNLHVTFFHFVPPLVHFKVKILFSVSLFFFICYTGKRKFNHNFLELIQ